MTLVFRYISRRVLRSIGLAFLIVTAVIMLVDFVEATRNIGDEGGFSLLQLAGLTLLKVPQLIEETIPFVVLFGVMGALYGLNKRSELVVLRASGLSAWQFLWPAVLVSAAIGIIWAGLFNPLAARSMAKYQDIIIQASQEQDNEHSPANVFDDQAENVWLREGTEAQQIVIHGALRKGDPLTLHDATFYYYNVDADLLGETRYAHRIDAKTARLNTSSEASGNYWQLRGVIKNLEENRFERAYAVSLPTRITAAELRDQKKSSRKTPFWGLRGEIQAAQDAGFSTVRLRLQWHKLLALPLMLVALTIIAAGVSMGNVRSGGVIRLMLAGAAVGFAVYFFNNLINAFGQSQTLSILTASWTVPALVLLLGLSYLARLEDG